MKLYKKCPKIDILNFGFGYSAHLCYLNSILAPVRQSQSATVSLLANSAFPRPELTTEFIPWSARYFTKQLMRHDCIECDCDHESKRHWSREWMYNRNAKTRSKADQEYALLRNKMAKIDSSLHPNLPNTT